MSLNPEPSKPAERSELDLPPKSYASVLQEDANGNAHRENGQINSRISNGATEDSTLTNGTYSIHDKKVIEDNHNADGEHVKSAKPSNEFEKHPRQAKKDYSNGRALKKQEDNEGLLSGKRPGEGWHRSGIRFAPLNVPLQRRLQTLLVLWHTTCIPILVTTFFFLCAVPIFWPILLPYLIYVLFSSSHSDGTLKRRSSLMRSSKIWSLFASYFPVQIHRSQPLPPTRKYIFGYHPHGIISHGAFAAFGTEACGFSTLFPGITNTLLTLETNFRLPLYRDYILALGLGSVSKESCIAHLSKGGANGEGMGRAITIVVGGASESLDAQPGSLRLILHKRKGFVKLAIRQGADLVPVLAFGENELYRQVDATSHPTLHKMQIMVKKLLGFTVPLFHARGVFNYDVGLLPYRKPVHVVIGRPIKVTQIAEPRDVEVDEIHAMYVSELERLWETWKDDYSDESTKLEIVE